MRSETCVAPLRFMYLFWQPEQVRQSLTATLNQQGKKERKKKKTTTQMLCCSFVWRRGHTQKKSNRSVKFMCVPAQPVLTMIHESDMLCVNAFLDKFSRLSLALRTLFSFSGQTCHAQQRKMGEFSNTFQMASLSLEHVGLRVDLKRLPERCIRNETSQI